jgi:ribosomal-protein-alanine N-acetyltransferase
MSISEDRAVGYVRLCRDHIERLLVLEQESYRDPWTPGMFFQELTTGSSHFFVVQRDEEIIGYGGFWMLLDEAHITKITIAEPFRKQGLGSELLDFLIGRARVLGAKAVRLEVRTSNEAARRLYYGHGFEDVGVRKGYYARSGEDALVMVKYLEQ